MNEGLAEEKRVPSDPQTARSQGQILRVKDEDISEVTRRQPFPFISRLKSPIRHENRNWSARAVPWSVLFRSPDVVALRCLAMASWNSPREGDVLLTLSELAS